MWPSLQPGPTAKSATWRDEPEEVTRPCSRDTGPPECMQPVCYAKGNGYISAAGNGATQRYVEGNVYVLDALSLRISPAANYHYVEGRSYRSKVSAAWPAPAARSHCRTELASWPRGQVCFVDENGYNLTT